MKKVLLAAFLFSGAASPPAVAASDDSYLAGFAAGVLEAELGLKPSDVSVEGGTVTVRAPRLSPSERRSAARALFAGDGIDAVRFEGHEEVHLRDRAPTAKAYRALPRRLLFAPLLADPRWPAFASIVTRHFRRDRRQVFNGNVGESFALVGAEDWQFGLQACIFTQFDMVARHNDQLTDDFLVGFPYSWRRGRAVWMARLYHISTHTGDELLMYTPGFIRKKISFEAVDLRLSYEIGNRWRVYGGPGILYRRYPEEMRPLMGQLGLEYAHDTAWKGLLRPVAAIDIQKRQTNGWGATNISARAGFQIEHRSQPSRRAMLLLEYYRGRDVNGQFFVNPDESLGLGLHLYF